MFSVWTRFLWLPSSFDTNLYPRRWSRLFVLVLSKLLRLMLWITWGKRERDNRFLHRNREREREREQIEIIKRNLKYFQERWNWWRKFAVIQFNLSILQLTWHSYRHYFSSSSFSLESLFFSTIFLLAFFLVHSHNSFCSLPQVFKRSQDWTLGIVVESWKKMVCL